MLNGLELTFMGVTGSNSSLFSTPGLVSHLWEKEKGVGRRKKKKGRRGKGNRKGKEGKKE